MRTIKLHFETIYERLSSTRTRTKEAGGGEGKIKMLSSYFISLSVGIAQTPNKIMVLIQKFAFFPHIFLVGEKRKLLT
jgi:hypothetical protein